MAAGAGFGYPCVVKAPDRQGQKGLVLVRDESVLAAAFDLALGESRSSIVLVEELVPGREVTVNAFSVEGRFTPLTITDRVVAEPPAFGVALAHVWPSSLAPAEVGAAVERRAPRRRRSACARARPTRRSWSASGARTSSSSPPASAGATTRSSAKPRWT